MIISYDLPENRSFLNSLKELGFSYILKSIKDESLFKEASDFKPDYILSIHFRDLIPKRYLDLSPGQAMNVHPSLLPKHAGCFATMWAIIDGDEETGVSYHLMNDKFDEGNILHQKKITNLKSQTGETLYNKAIDVAVEEFPIAFELLKQGFKGQSQFGQGSYHNRKIPFAGKIDLSWSDEQVERFIRAMHFTGKQGALVESKYGIKEVRTFEEFLVLKGNNT